MFKLLLLGFFFLATLTFGQEEDVDGESLNIVLTEEQEAQVASGASAFEFQAEVSRLMEIIIHSLYKNRDIFLRELISNANDAIDKIRYKSLTDKEALGSATDLQIKVQADPASNTITILDTGIGMTKDELTKNLGTIAHSGTASFLDAFAKASESGENPLALIGQFGVGFYSAFLIADEVTVISKSNKDEKQWIWRSKADGKFSVSEDPRGPTLVRGTAVILKMKEDAKNFLQSEEIEKTIQRYSEFMQYPIYLYSSKTETVEIESDETESELGDDELDVGDEDEEKKPKTEERTTTFWKRLNKNKPLWTRRPSTIEDDEYNSFYQAFTRDVADPIAHTHFRAEGEIEFDSILFIPGTAPHGMYDNYYQQKSTLRLYVRRVLISDEFEDIIPRYLSFVKGLVDSNDLPLNVNREDLQKNKIMSLISRKLTRKALDMIRDVAREEEEDDDEEEEGEDKSGDEDEDKKVDDKKESRYAKFWKEFGKSIKLGVLEDTRNKKRLLELLRFPSSKAPDAPISLRTYVDRMKEGQKFIYFVAAGSLDEAENSPFMERFKLKDIEVLYFVDNLDEYMNLNNYDDVDLQSITKEGVELDGKRMKEFLEEKEAEFTDLKDWLKDVYGMKISKVQISPTLHETPMAVVTAKYGYSAHMEKIAKSQAFGANNYPYQATKILQLNYRHPMIKELRQRIADGEHENDGDALKDYANLLLDMALIKSGFEIEADDQDDFAARVTRIVGKALDVSPDATFEEEPEFANELGTEDEGEEEEDDDEEEEWTEDEDESEKTEL